MDFVTSPQWVDMVEQGTNQQIVSAFGEGIDGLSSKLLNAYGADVAVSMPIEMVEWIKDSTILWIKNKGAGPSTNEATVLEQSTIARLTKEMTEIRDFYDN